MANWRYNYLSFYLLLTTLVIQIEQSVRVCACVCMYELSTKRSLTFIFGILVHLDKVKFEGESHSRVYVDLYSASSSVVTTSNALRHGSHSFTYKLHHTCLYSPAAEHHRPSAGTHFAVPRRIEGWVDLVVGYIPK